MIQHMLTYQITSKRKHSRQSYDVISVFQEGGHRVGNQPPGFGFSDNTKIRSRDTFLTHSDLILHFFVSAPRDLYARQI